MSSLLLSAGSLTGTLGGKVLHCLLTPTALGPKPPPGEYYIQHAVEDSIYGVVAVMVPAGDAMGTPGGTSA